MAYILNFYDEISELDELRQVFLALDKSKDGLLSLSEI
jgi:hypothetical protein